MCFTLGEVIITPFYIIITAIIIIILAVIDCSRTKELTVEPTQVSMMENSKISVFTREGETNIEMPSHLSKLKEYKKSGKSNERESIEVKKLDGKEEKKESESNLILMKLEKYHPSKEKYSRNEEVSAKSGNQGEKANDENEKSAKQTQSSDIKIYNHENKEKSTEKKESLKFDKHKGC